MFSIFAVIFFLSIGVLLFTFNKKIAQYEVNRRIRSSNNVDGRLIETQLYIAGAFSLVIGLLNLVWSISLFSK